jgi:fibronectin type 3 domain-containing protein
LDQDYSAQSVIPENVVLGNVQKSYTAATLSYNDAARAIQYYSNSDESGSTFVGIEPFINGNLSISIKVNSDSTYSSVNIIGSTFWIEALSLSGGGARVIVYYQPSSTAYSYKYYDVPASALPNGVNTINIMVSGTTKTLTVYHDSTYTVTTPMYHWSVQNLPYSPITSPIICFDNYQSSVSTWVSTYIYAIKETVSGGLVSAVPGNDFVPFGIDYPRSSYNSMGTQYMAARDQKGVAWADLQWLEYQPQDKAYIESLLANGWELGIHYNAALNNYPIADAQALMRQQYDQLTQMFGRAPTSWCSYQNADSVTHAIFAYQQLGMMWRNGFSGISYIPNVGNLQETRWTEFWSDVSNAQMVYPSFTHKTDQTSAEAYAISYASFTEWIDNYQGKQIIGFNEYYHRVSNQIDTKIQYLEYTQGERLKFSVQCNAFQSRLMIDFPMAQSAVVLKNGSPLVLGSDYSVVDGHYIVLFSNNNDVFEVTLNGAPSAPRDLTATPGNAQVTLTWTAPASNGGSAVTGYKIYRGTTSGGETLLTTLGNVLTYTDSGLTNGQRYYYKVSAVSSAGEGSQSNEASATPLAVPSSPTLASAVPGNAQVVLTWSAPTSNGGSAVTGYKIYRGTASGTETLLTTVGNVLTYTDSGLTNGQTYYYKVSAVNVAGEGSQSNEVSAKPVTLPSAPRALAATGGDAQVTLTWTAPASNGGTSIIGYKIYRGTASGSEVLLTTVGNVLTYTDTSAINGQPYFYKVSAVSSVGEGAQSSEASATPELIVTAPSAPRNLEAAAGNAQVVLTWTAPSSNGGASVTGYKIYRGGALLTTVGNVLTYTDSSVTNGQTYTYVVSAVNSAGESPQSNQVTAKPATLPSAPQNLVATKGNAQVVLTWAAPASNGGSAVTGYKVYRGTVSGGESLLAIVGNVLTYTDSGLTNGQTYFYRVSAVTAAGEGAQSSEASATPTTVPSAPQALAATGGNAQVTLTWSAPSSNGGTSITGYKIYRGTTSGGETLLTTLGNVLTYTDSGLTNGQRYYYKVSAINSVGEGPMSSEASATPAAPATMPSAPQSLQANAGDAQVVLTWSAPSSNGGSAVTGYKIYRGTASGGETLLATVGNVLTYTDSGLTNGLTYYYKVSAVNSVGEGPQSSEASATPVRAPTEGLEYELINGGTEVQITGYHGTGGAVAIPSSIDGKPVTSIANFAFYGNTAITSLTLSSGLLSIGNYAFYRCSAITSVTLPSGLQSIGEYAFGSCTALKSVAIPGSVTTIGSTAFYNCIAMSSVTMSSGLLSIGDHAFYGCTVLGSIIIPGTVTTMGSWAFAYSGVTSVTIPGSVTAIGSYAFYGCTALTSVTMSSGIQGIGTQAFRGCTALTSVTIPGSVTAIGSYAFFGCTSMTSLTLSSGPQSIGEYAFYSCTALTSVTIPGSVTAIGSYAFASCSRMSSLTLSSGLLSIGDHAFYGCTALTSVTIPATVTTIGNYGFYGCTAMTSIYFAGNAPTVGTGWISNRNAALKIYYHSGATGFTTPTWQGVTTATY